VLTVGGSSLDGVTYSCLPVLAFCLFWLFLCRRCYCFGLSLGGFFFFEIWVDQERRLFRDACFGLFMTDRTQKLRWTSGERGCPARRIYEMLSCFVEEGKRCQLAKHTVSVVLPTLHVLTVARTGIN
jgi:hypothetical protein